jgi:hypothetical protein
MTLRDHGFDADRLSPDRVTWRAVAHSASLALVASALALGLTACLAAIHNAAPWAIDWLYPI